MTKSVKAEQQQPALQSLVSAGGEHVRSVSEADQAALRLAHPPQQQQLLDKELDENNGGGKAGEGDGEEDAIDESSSSPTLSSSPIDSIDSPNDAIIAMLLVPRLVNDCLLLVATCVSAWSN